MTFDARVRHGYFNYITEAKRCYVLRKGDHIYLHAVECSNSPHVIQDVPDYPSV